MSKVFRNFKGTKIVHGYTAITGISRFIEALSPETSMAGIKLKRTELEITRKRWIKIKLNS